MQVYFDWVVLIQLFCIVQGFTTGIYLLVTKKQQPSHKWLGWLLLGLTLQIIDYFLSRSGIYYRNRWLYFSPFFFSWSFGPLIYCYVKAGFSKKRPRIVLALCAGNGAIYFLFTFSFSTS